MTGRELCEKLNYIGMERSLRQIAIDDKIAPVEKLAVMTTEEVCSLVVEKYEVVRTESECIELVRISDLPKYEKALSEVNKYVRYAER